MAEIKHATDATFEELVLNNDKPVVVDFWAAWCGPCKMVAPEMEKLAAKYDGVVDVVKVDVDANPGLSQAFGDHEHPARSRCFKPGEQPQGVVGLPPARAARAGCSASRAARRAGELTPPSPSHASRPRSSTGAVSIRGAAPLVCGRPVSPDTIPYPAARRCPSRSQASARSSANRSGCLGRERDPARPRAATGACPACAARPRHRRVERHLEEVRRRAPRTRARRPPAARPRRRGGAITPAEVLEDELDALVEALVERLVGGGRRRGRLRLVERRVLVLLLVLVRVGAVPGRRSPDRLEDRAQLLRVLLVVLRHLAEEVLLVRRVLDPACLGDHRQVAAQLARGRSGKRPAPRPSAWRGSGRGRPRSSGRRRPPTASRCAPWWGSPRPRRAPSRSPAPPPATGRCGP